MTEKPEDLLGIADGLRALAEMRGEGAGAEAGPQLQPTDYLYDPLGALKQISIDGNTALKPAENPNEYACPIRFQGQWADEETGLYYNRFRYYDPNAAKYMSPDPIGIRGGFKAQGYVNSPTQAVDAFGLSETNCKKRREKIPNVTVSNDIILNLQNTINIRKRSRRNKHNR